MPLMRGRELKPMQRQTTHKGEIDAPYAGARIETMLFILPRLLTMDAPYAGARIETNKSCR